MNEEGFPLVGSFWTKEATFDAVDFEGAETTAVDGPEMEDVVSASVT